MKKLIFLFSTVALLGACCNSNKTNTNADKKECASISVDSFLVLASDYVGKELTVKGTVDHVCKHGGKRVKLISTISGNSIHGEASEKIGAFNAELEGSDICLTGIVLETKIDMAYVDEWETKENEAIAKNAEESEMEHKEGVDHHANLEQIKKYREDIRTSGKDYITFYALDATDYHECDASINEGCGNKGIQAEDTIKAPTGEETEGSACGGCKDKKEGCGDK